MARRAHHSAKDDIIQRLAPSLSAYAGCTVIDVNPGPCLFSSKLHNFLRPKSHILVERTPERYAEAQNKLIRAKGSRYCHKQYNRRDLVSLGPEGLRVANGTVNSSETRSSDSLILIVANLTNRSQSEDANLPYSQAADFAREAGHAMANGLQPPPRMLMWMNDKDKQGMLPRAAIQRSKLSVMLDRFCRVHEIAGMKEDVKHSLRQTALIASGQERVAEHMKRQGIITSSDRAIERQTQPSDKNIRTKAWHKEMEDLEQGLTTGQIPQFVGIPPGPLVDLRSLKASRRKDPRQLTPEYTRWKELRKVYRTLHVRAGQHEDLLRMQCEIDELSRAAIDPQINDDDGEDRERMLRESDEKSEQLKRLLAEKPPESVREYHILDDDHRGFHMDPPLLQWDRRPFEPLIARLDEFTYKGEVTLLDFQALHCADLAPEARPSSTDENMYFEWIAATTMGHSRGHVGGLKVLGGLAPGAYDAIIKGAPLIRDPTRGGRRDLDTLRSRTLTCDMLSQMAKAFYRWPFKPPLMEVLNEVDDEQLDPAQGRGRVY